MLDKASSSSSSDAIDARGDQIAANLARLFEPGQKFEIRTLPPRDSGDHSVSGIFDDPHAAAGYALAAEADGDAVYFGLNPHYLPATNEQTRGPQPKDATVSYRRWLLVDIDPVRPANTSSTVEEKAAAKSVFGEVCQWLQEQGWSVPLMADSGNGWHALFPINLPNDGEATELIKRILHALAAEFDTEEAKVDTTVYNASRICRLYGTTNLKGANTPERPHRQSKLVGKSGTQPVPLAALHAVAALAPATIASRTKEAKGEGNTAATPGDGESLLGSGRMEAKYGIPAPEILAKAASYMQNALPSIEGQEGSKQMYKVVCALIQHFGLAAEEALPFLADYNRSCVPEWSESEIQHKIKSVIEKEVEGDPAAVGDWLREKEIEGPAKNEEEEESSFDVLSRMVQSRCILWHDPDNVPYATVRHDDGHLETVEISSGGGGESSAFELWMARMYWVTHKEATGKGATIKPGDQQKVIQICQGLAIHDGETYVPRVRLGEDNGNIYLDLGNETWETIEITTRGWQVMTDTPPVKFRRPNGIRPLPMPTPGGKGLNTFRELFNIRDDDQWNLICGWLVMALRPHGPYPILVVNGEAGSAKTTICEALRKLIDPCIANLASVPREDRDIAITAGNSWVVGYDNLSHIKEDLADRLCKVATGMGFRVRGHYKNGVEVFFVAERPQIINGIGELARRDDMLSRAVMIRMEPPEKRLTRKKLWELFEEIQADILGELLDIASHALGHFEELEDMPRMADFAAWVTAAEPKLGWTKGAFVASFLRNIEQGREVVLGSSTLALPIIELAKAAGDAGWEGSATDLLDALQRTTEAQKARSRGAFDMPKTPASLSGAITRLQASLAQKGVIIEREKRGGNKQGTRVLRIIYKDPA